MYRSNQDHAVTGGRVVNSWKACFHRSFSCCTSRPDEQEQEQEQEQEKKEQKKEQKKNLVLA
jgi:hypothetical protein